MLTVIAVLLGVTLLAVPCVWLFQHIYTPDLIPLTEKQTIRYYMLLLCVSSFFYFSLLFWWGFNIKFFGFNGFRITFLIGLAATLAFYPVVNKEIIPKIWRRLALGLSIIPYILLCVAVVPYVGYLLVISPVARILGTERDVKFENEKYRLEQIEGVPMSGGRSDFYLVLKKKLYEKVIAEYYGEDKEFEGIRDITIEEGKIHFGK